MDAAWGVAGAGCTTGGGALPAGSGGFFTGFAGALMIFARSSSSIGIACTVSKPRKRERRMEERMVVVGKIKVKKQKDEVRR
jgi:hypothetical protein